MSMPVMEHKSVPVFSAAGRPTTPAPQETLSVYYDREYRETVAARQNQERRIKRFLAFIDTLPDDLASVVQATWSKVEGRSPGFLPAPLVDERDEGGVLLSWDKGIHHLDVEITAEGALDFFYLNRVTDEKWDIEAMATDVIPEKVMEAFDRFCFLR